MASWTQLLILVIFGVNDQGLRLFAFAYTFLYSPFSQVLFIIISYPHWC